MLVPNPKAPLSTEPPLPVFTDDVRRNEQISWYRSPLPPGAMKQLHERSDWRAAAAASNSAIANVLALLRAEVTA